LEPGRVLDQNKLAIAFSDAFPISPGHTLVVPRRHVSDFFELSPAEIADLVELLFRIHHRLVAEQRPSGFNIGVNVGAAAGQTVLHAHVHLIPRFIGDVTEPQGGVRSIIPGKGPYS
jgi:diadenosine tetraphosphate (Ap4A) HIT family hydrolase